MTILRASSVLSLSVFNSCLITQRSFSTTSEMVKKVKFAQLMAGASLFFKHPARIIQSNDDGWAESYIRVLNNALIEAGHDVVLSAPAENMSGTSSIDIDPEDRKLPCHYDSCGKDNGPVGVDSTRNDLYWVNSFPVTALRYGIERFAPDVWNGTRPNLAVIGPNVGSNLGWVVPYSSTVGAAAYAAHVQRIPAIAFSGATHGNLEYSEPSPQRSIIYAQLATRLVSRIVQGGWPYLPEDVFLNVNLPRIRPGCEQVTDVRWVLSRIYPGYFQPADIHWCGSDRLPEEVEVLKMGCYASISIGDAKDKSTVSDERQGIVLTKLHDMLTCMP